MRARTLELTLLVLGTVITVVAYGLLNAGSADIRADIAGFFVVTLLLLIGATS